MAPVTVESRHVIALLIAAVIGAALGFVFGYMIYGIARGAEGGVSFGSWARHPIRYDGIWWAAFGAVIGAGLAYVRRQMAS